VVSQQQQESSEHFIEIFISQADLFDPVISTFDSDLQNGDGVAK